MKIFSTVFRDFGKNTLGKRYFNTMVEEITVEEITEKNNEKSGFEIIKNDISIFGHLSKKNFFFILTLVSL